MRFKLLVPTILAASLAMLAPAAHAILLTGTAVGFSDSLVVSDVEGGGVTNFNVSTGSSTSHDMFRPADGVLTGASLRLVSTRTQSLQVTSSDGPNNGSSSSVTSSGVASGSISVVRLTGNTTVASIGASASCTASRTGACTGTPTGSPNVATNANVGIPDTALNLYAGLGTVSIGRSASGFVSQLNNAFTGTETSRYQLDWAGTLALDYTYLLHAAPSFSAAGSVAELTLDFGTVSVGDAAMLDFSIFNLAGERAGLDLDSIVADGDSAVLGIDLGLFDGLEAGSDSDWRALLDTSSAGNYRASYTLLFSDADIGAESTRASRQMTLNLLGNVIEPPVIAPLNAVPEPASLLLVAVGLVALSAGARRKGGRA